MRRSTTVRFFVDTNLLIYARDPKHPPKQVAAQAWMSYLWRHGNGALSFQVLQEFYANMTRKFRADPGPVQADIRELLGWKPILVDSDLLAAAWVVEARYGITCWDSLIVAAAQMADCEVLLSEDLSDGQVYGGVTVVNPFKTAPGDAP